MLFKYKAVNAQGAEQTGEIEAVSNDVAISALQKRGLIVVNVSAVSQKNWFSKNLPFIGAVKTADIVLLARQAATLFQASISASRAFSLLSENTDNPNLKNALGTVTEDLKGGNTLADAMAKFPRIFSDFFVAMVRAGEESGKLTDTLNFLADHMERQHEIQSKTKNALVYPAFVVVVFIVVMSLMMTKVIPQMSEILLEFGKDIPISTKIVIWVSNFFVEYGIFLFILLVAVSVFSWYQVNTTSGRMRFDFLKLSLPYFGDLYNKVCLARIADNITTMMGAGIPIIRTLEITADVVGNRVYEQILRDGIEKVRAGSALSDAFVGQQHVPAIFSQMIRVGEETGSIGEVLHTLARFYAREVRDTVDTIISMIEPVMIIVLAVGVGVLMASVLIPLYNLAGTIAA